jgi:hypothetical protein
MFFLLITYGNEILWVLETADKVLILCEKRNFQSFYLIH